MAINIFSGGGTAKSTKAPRVSSADERAKATTAALNAPASASDSGATAVKSGGILGKIGSFVGKAGSILGKVLPGPAGMIAGAVGNLLSSNDPEWWQHVRGDGLSVNAPLTPVELGRVTVTGSVKRPLLNMRPTFLAFTSSIGSGANTRAMVVTDRMATQYIMPAVRKVVNAITLQGATAYSSVFAAQATVYAIWRNLKKFDYMVKRGFTFVPNLNDPAFPVLQVANSAWLQSVITRLEEYLHSHVRLPHTLCEYLTWRYGKLFRSNTSAKAGIVMYNVLKMTASVADYETLISGIQNFISATEATQKAASDLYNAYMDHDQEVFVSEETIYSYDAKEFTLRTNLDLIDVGTDADPWGSVDQNPIMIDSNLDNVTVFMASTVSCDYDNSRSEKPLFPVTKAFAYMAKSASEQSFFQYYLPCDNTGTGAQASSGWGLISGSTLWMEHTIEPAIIQTKDQSNTPTSAAYAFAVLQMAEVCKALDFYNVGIFVPNKINNASGMGAIVYTDLTSLSIDLGQVPDLTIQNEQVIAFANLAYEGAKNAESYRTLEKRVAKDVANFVESNEISAMSAK